MIDEVARLSVQDEAPMVTKDITEEYLTACRTALGLGDLMRLPTFSLQDAVVSCEIMDPKMDNGMRETSEEVERPPYDCARALSIQEMIEIMDRLFATEMTWHTGASLSQTLYTCVYLQKIVLSKPLVTQFSTENTGDTVSMSLLDEVLYPYVAATIKCSAILREEYLTGYLYEEEDVSSADFGLDLLSHTHTDDITARLRAGLTWLDLQMEKEALSLPDRDLLEQLRLRMTCRMHFMLLLLEFDDPENWQTHIDILLHTLCSIEVGDLSLDKADEIFSTKIQRSLTSTSPPRPLMSMSIAQAHAEFAKACRDLSRISQTPIFGKTSPTRLMSFFDHIRRNVSQALPLVRSRMQNLFLADKTDVHIANKQTFLVTAIEEVSGPNQKIFQASLAKVEQPSDARFQVSTLVTSTLSRMDPFLLEYFKVSCHNPGRQRRNLCKLLTEFDHIQVQTEEVDEVLAELVHEVPKQLSNGQSALSYPISSFIFSTKLDMMLMILFLGFETDLYLPWEYGVIYWHLDNLLFLQCEHLYTIAMERIEGNGTIKRHLKYRMAYAEALRYLCQGCFRFMQALRPLALLPDPAGNVLTHELMYRHRMRPFASLVSPPAPSYEAYAKAYHHLDGTPGELLMTSRDCFTAGRAALSRLHKHGPSPLNATVPVLVEDFERQMKGLLGCCIANTLTLSALLKRLEAGQQVGGRIAWSNEKFDKRFPVFSIASST